MYTIKIGSLILALVLFATSAAFAENYPPGLPTDFEKYPQKFCEREAPTALYLKTYANIEDDGWAWVVQIFGKDKKNLFVLELRRNIMDISTTIGRIRLWEKNDWYEPENEQEGNRMLNQLFTTEEHMFLKSCPVE
ncbi:MAG: hypothetical protein Q7R73_01580 [bacterium]|nr:hypothetical protein [bacterium]